MSDANVFAKYACYYDLLYKDKDYAGEGEYIAGLIRQYQPEADAILELGSGTGKHARILAEKGYRVHGIEKSEGMLAQARDMVQRMHGMDERWRAPKFSQGDIRDARIEDSFDVVISLFHVISYQITNADLAAAFQTARTHLDKEGLFIFDVWYGPAVLTDRPAVRVKRMADDQIEVTRVAEPVMHPNANGVDVNYQVFIRNLETEQVLELHEKHSMRYLFYSEIAMLAEQEGFRLERGEEWMTGKALDFSTWGAGFVLRAV